jgi:two-component system, chemotaxis family, chemotaxis protein CheY
MLQTMRDTILVVEDDPGICEALVDALELEGYTVQLANNGAEALKQIEAEPPRLLLLDVMMPVMDGITMVGELTARGLRDQLAILIMTANGRAKQWAAQVGARGTLAAAPHSRRRSH